MNLKRKIEILGLEIPIFLIVAALIAAPASAALLNYYGTISGTSNVVQSVLLNGEDYTVTHDFSIGSIGPGETARETHTLENTADSEASVLFQTTCGNGDGEQQSNENNIDWNKGTKECAGITTRYVEYYDEAGHDFSDYAVDVTCDVTVPSDKDFQTSISELSVDETICVEAGTYTGDVTIDTEDVTIVALNAPDTADKAVIEGRINVKADGVTVKGFNIQNPPATSGEMKGIFIGNPDGSSIDVSDEKIIIDSNVIEEMDASGTSETAIAIQAKAYDGSNEELRTIDGLEIVNNWIKGVNQPNSGAYGMMLQANVKNSEIMYNTVEGLTGSWEKALGITYSSNEQEHPKSVDVTYNELEGSVGLDDVPGSEVTVGSNNFVGSGIDLGNINSGQNQFADEDLVANDNWFGVDGIVTNTEHDLEMDASITASYETKTDMTLEPGEVDKFGVINDFAINLETGTYDLMMKVLPA